MAIRYVRKNSIENHEVAQQLATSSSTSASKYAVGFSGSAATGAHAREASPQALESPQPRQLGEDTVGSGLQLIAAVEKAVDSLKPWPDNPRAHSEKQLSKLMESIRVFGFTVPILIDEHGVILAGHGRVEAAKRLGLAVVPCRVLVGLTQDAKRAYVLADNKIAELAKWDTGLLQSELKLLVEADFNLEVTGFSTAEVDLILEPVESPPTVDKGDLTEADILPHPVSRLGDLWILDKHRLICASAHDEAAYAQLIRGDYASLVAADAPYNVPIQGHVCGKGQTRHGEFIQGSGEMSSEQFTEFLRLAFVRAKAVSTAGALHFYYMDWRSIREILDAGESTFGRLRQLCVWAKDNGGMGTFYRSRHELVFIFKNGDAPHINNFELGQHGRYRTNVWEYAGVNTFSGKGYELLKYHPTVKPVVMIADILRDCSRRGDVVLDCFAGSGTILIAAERTGRQARAIELDPKYVDVAVCRWQRVTGKTAILASTGQTWAEVDHERRSSANPPVPNAPAGGSNPQILSPSNTVAKGQSANEDQGV